MCVYAIGDIHGTADHLANLMAKISVDRQRHGLPILLIFLGDFIDRGPASNSTIDLLVALGDADSSHQKCVFLKGNHEQMLLSFIESPQENGLFWLNNGGDETLKSYGVHPPVRPSSKQLSYLRDELVDRLPDQHLKFFQCLVPSFTVGDYFFCHGGVDTSLALDKQTEHTLIWTREVPDSSSARAEKIIVHGHTPVAAPVTERYHINVDTGAYATGRLTALRLLGTTRQFISTDVVHLRN